MKSPLTRPGPESPTLLAIQALYQLRSGPCTFYYKGQCPYGGRSGPDPMVPVPGSSHPFTSHRSSLSLTLDVSLGYSEIKDPKLLPCMWSLSFHIPLSFQDSTQQGKLRMLILCRLPDPRTSPGSWSWSPWGTSGHRRSFKAREYGSGFSHGE